MTLCSGAAADDDNLRRVHDGVRRVCLKQHVTFTYTLNFKATRRTHVIVTRILHTRAGQKYV